MVTAFGIFGNSLLFSTFLKLNPAEPMYLQMQEAVTSGHIHMYISKFPNGIYKSHIISGVFPIPSTLDITV